MLEETAAFDSFEEALAVAAKQRRVYECSLKRASIPGDAR
jgi:hypothetical protein